MKADYTMTTVMVSVEGDRDNRQMKVDYTIDESAEKK